MAPPAIQEEDEGGITMVVPRRNGNIRAQPPSNLPISPVATMAPHVGAAGPVRRTPSTGPRRGSFLARQNAIQTSSGSISHQSESSSHSHSPSPVCTPLPFSESSRTYRGSVPNIVGATRSSPFQPSPASRPNHHHGNPTVSYSQPSLNSSRSRSSSRSPLGGASSSTSDHSAHAPIPRISPPPQTESRRRGYSRSGSTSPNQLQLPLKTLGGRPTDRCGSGGYTSTMFCPPADGAPPPPYDDCFDSEEQDRIKQDLAEVKFAKFIGGQSLKRGKILNFLHLNVLIQLNKLSFHSEQFYFTYR